ncbi:MAG: PAS domain S-box protein [Candidatus Latescibacteria bacterium]|nr:PAS domain S-box protein [Candidatus Latescibacterota bacterium]NIM22610.1 PAS domain S-box protein [Candidatus Latescibacterota bacterium]NIM64899.1 PAS domain S-box protein [Candidatus Latescibacterota bacterium]NIO01414.1 PAS domain S-box protein [Candidatus Latescibacterota bacterium]NIO27924.1 PAS domain S-box protein [Candidatus Latescibacterota bacterium]
MNLYATAVVLVLAAWGALYLQHIAGIEFLSGIPAYVPVALSILGAVFFVRAPVSLQIRLTFYIVVLSILVAGFALIAAGRDRDALEEKWRASDSNLIRKTFLTVGEEVQQLAELSGYIGSETRRFLAGDTAAAVRDSLAFNLEAFRVLQSLAKEIEASGKLPPGAEIGIQLLDDSGWRIAWAGWPQPLLAMDYELLRPGEDILYTREVSLYRILTRIIPIRDPSKAPRWYVVVDTPLEINYKVNNKYLKSTSLAETIAGKLKVNVRFDYYPPAAGFQDRARYQAGPADSALAGYGYPSYIEPISKITGDKTLGLSGRVAIKSSLGNPLLNVTVHGRPFRHFVDSHAQSLLAFAKGFIVLALMILFILSLTRFPHRLSGRFGLVRIAYVIVFFIVLRFAVLSLKQAPLTGGLQIFDPAIFATPIFRGLMQSAGDLLITAIFLVTALYAVLKIARQSPVEAREQPSPNAKGLVVLKGLFTAAALISVLEIAQRFIHTVVENANPRLLGETMKVFQSQVLVLHLSMFLMLSGFFLAGLLCAWGMLRIRGMRNALSAGGIAFLVIVLVAALGWGWECGFISTLLLVFLVFAPRFTRREDLVSIVIVAFSFVVIGSGAAYLFLNDEYQNLRKNKIQLEYAADLAQPLDSWKIFVLEEIMESFSKNPTIRQALRKPEPEVTRRLAFDLWAGSSLSLLGYSSAVYVLSPEDSVMGRFAVDMPFRVRPSEETERTDTDPAQEWVVLDLTKSTPQGDVRFYRGILNIEDIVGKAEGGFERVLLGKIIVDAPFSFENLAWAARAGPRAPELLRNVEVGSIEPRLEAPEALLLAHLEDSRVVETSTEDLPVGLRLPDEQLEKARGLRWPLLRTEEGTYRYMIQDAGDSEHTLLVGFQVPTPLWHVLRWSTIFSLYLFYTAFVLIVIVLLKWVPYLGSLLPTLTPGRRLGFQQKLLGSFFIVALLPAIILGIFSVYAIRDRFISENREEAMYKAYSARKAIAALLSDELDSFLYHTDLRMLFSGEKSPEEVVPGDRLIKLLDERGTHLDFTSRGEASTSRGESSTSRGASSEPEGELSPAAGASGDTAGKDLTDSQVTSASGELPEAESPENLEEAVAGGLSPGDIRIVWKGDIPYIGIVSQPIMMFGEAERQSGYIYYARRLDGDFLVEIADQVGTDINIYDDGHLVASSREGLLTGGFISPVMNADAFVKVSLLGVDQSLSTERAGDYRYQVAYLPIESGSKMKRAALGLPLLFRPEPYHVEVQKATSIVLGIFALLFAATIGLGLLLARGIFEPLKSLLEGTKRISRGDLSFKLPAARSDEIGTVVNAFNEMTAQLDQSQRVLEERRRYLEVILVNIGTGVMSTDEEDRIRTVNSAAERILGIDAKRAMGKTPETLVEEGIAPEIFSLLKGRSQTEEPFIASEVEVARDGTKRTIKYMLTKLVFDGSYLGTVFVFEDLTELINSKKLSAWVEMARQIAHEIKNPLTPIKISTQFMQRAHEVKSPEFDRIFEEGSHTIIQQVDVLKRIAGEFSSFGRMQELDVGSHRLVPLLQDIINPYRSNTAGVNVSSDFSCGDIMVAVDPEAVRKICVNLIENAMEAMPDGGSLDVSCEKITIDSVVNVRVTFRDTGPGLNDEAQEKLFEPYFSTKTTGTGLGLAICRSLSREMGGEVMVENVSDGPGVEAAVLFKGA